MEALSDNRLMLNVKAGNVDQLGLLFERYHRRLYGFFFRRLRDAELSEDLVQNVFVRVLKYRHQFRGDGEFNVWLFHIARNVQHDFFRRRRLPVAGSAEDWQEQLEDQALTPSQEMIKREEQQQLQAALRRLDPDKREVILMAKLQGLRYKEIGDLLGCSEGAVKVKVFRALQDLKKHYRDLDR